MKWSPAVGAAAEPGRAGVDGLISQPIAGPLDGRGGYRGAGGSRRAVPAVPGCRGVLSDLGSVRGRTIQRPDFAAGFQHQAKSMADDHLLAGHRPASRPRQDLPGPAGPFPQEQALPASARRLAAADQPRRYHPGIVPHQDIARVQQLGKIGEDSVLPGPMPTVDHHQSRPIARLGRVLRDQLRRQVEVEFRGEHAGLPAITHQGTGSAALTLRSNVTASDPLYFA